MPAIDALLQVGQVPMKTITSRDNPEYRKAKKLLRRKYREEMRLYLLEGIKPLKDALDRGAHIEKIFLREGGPGRDEIEGIQNDDLIVTPSDMFDELSDTETTQGVIAQEEDGSLRKMNFS